MHKALKFSEREMERRLVLSSVCGVVSEQHETNTQSMWSNKEKAPTSSLGDDISTEGHGDAAGRCAANGDIEVNNGVGHV